MNGSSCSATFPESSVANSPRSKSTSIAISIVSSDSDHASYEAYASANSGSLAMLGAAWLDRVVVDSAAPSSDSPCSSCAVGCSADS